MVTLGKTFDGSWFFFNVPHVFVCNLISNGLFLAKYMYLDLTNDYTILLKIFMET